MLVCLFIFDIKYFNKVGIILIKINVINLNLMMYKFFRRWFDYVISKCFSFFIFKLNFDCKIFYVLFDIFLFEC